MSQNVTNPASPLNGFLMVPNFLFNQHTNRPKLSAVDLLILANLCSWSKIGRPSSENAQRFNWESSETWADRLGVDPRTIRKSWHKLHALRLIGALTIKHKGRIYSLKYARTEFVEKWANPEAKGVKNSWFIDLPPAGKNGRPDWLGPLKETPVTNSAEDTKLIAWAAKPFELSQPKDIEQYILQMPQRVGKSLKMLEFCANYCGLDPAPYLANHPVRIAEARKRREDAERRKREKEQSSQFKGVKARTPDNVYEAILLENAKYHKTERIPDHKLYNEASRAYNYYDSAGWMFKGGQSINDIRDIAKFWVKRFVEDFHDRQRRAAKVEAIARGLDKRSNAPAAQPEPDPVTIDVDYSEA